MFMFKFKRFSTIIATVLLLTIQSCTELSDTERRSNPVPDLVTSKSIVSVENAIDRLNEFLSDLPTKSNDNRKIKSIETHYGNRNADGSVTPEAYLINFENNAGFAVLGANDKVAPIIAVTDSGSANWNTLLSMDHERKSLEEENYGITPDEMMSLCIRSALYGKNRDEDSSLTKGMLNENARVFISPITENLPFSQQRTYCHKKNRGYVVSGCAATALAIVVAHNRYPRMHVDHESIDYDACNQLDGNGLYFCFDDGREVFLPVSDYYIDYQLIPTNLDRNGKMSLLQKIDKNVFNVHSYSRNPEDAPFHRTRYKLVSSMFYILNNIIQSWKATGTLPAAVTNGLKELRYTNVSRKPSYSLTNSQIQHIFNMLSNNKPVIMGGWTLVKPNEAHYWVVDGLRQSSSETLIHCNWGWGGEKNGWFSSDCLRPEEAVEYDSTTDRGGSSNNMWNNLCLYVYDYDKDTYVPFYMISKIYPNRIKYYE